MCCNAPPLSQVHTSISTRPRSAAFGQTSGASGQHHFLGACIWKPFGRFLAKRPSITAHQGWELKAFEPHMTASNMMPTVSSLGLLSACEISRKWAFAHKCANPVSQFTPFWLACRPLSQPVSTSCMGSRACMCSYVSFYYALL